MNAVKIFWKTQFFKPLLRIRPIVYENGKSQQRIITISAMDPDMPNNGGPFNIFAPTKRDNPVINDFTLDFIPGGGGMLKEEGDEVEEEKAYEEIEIAKSKK